MAALDDDQEVNHHHFGGVSERKFDFGGERLLFMNMYSNNPGLSRCWVYPGVGFFNAFAVLYILVGSILIIRDKRFVHVLCLLPRVCMCVTMRARWWHCPCTTHQTAWHPSLHYLPFFTLLYFPSSPYFSLATCHSTHGSSFLASPRPPPLPTSLFLCSSLSSSMSPFPYPHISFPHPLCQ